MTEKCPIIGCCLERLVWGARLGWAVTACAWLFTRAALGGQPCLGWGLGLALAQAAVGCLEFRRGERRGVTSDRLHPTPVWSLDTRRHPGEKIENGEIFYWVKIGPLLKRGSWTFLFLNT